MKSFKWLTLTMLAAVLISCGEKTPTPLSTSASAQTNQQIYSVKGVVKELKPDGKTVVIQHEEISGYMAAMTMPFEVKDSKELTHLQPGDRVSFRMVVTKTEGWIDHIKKLGGAAMGELPSIQSFRRVRDVEPLNVGDVLPDYRFTNELGQAISLSGFKGQALAFTFIFTRCPFPNFCPRMSDNFSEVYKTLSTNGPANWHLFTISFDPAFDTPTVLTAYARKYQPDSKRWSFVTGEMLDVAAIAEQFGLSFSRQPGSFNFDHNMRTVVIDAQGKVQRIFIGNEWKPDELAAEIVKAAVVK